MAEHDEAAEIDDDDEVMRRYRRRVEVRKAFRPSAPVNERALFAGRSTQMRDMISVIAEVGQHGVVFGERGVGKTSLVSVVGDIMDDGTVLFVRVGCSVSDSFETVWKKALQAMQLTVRRQVAGFTGEVETTIVSVAGHLPESPTPGDIEALLVDLSGQIPVVVVIDEFDRIGDRIVTQQMADTIKTLSDRGADVTIVLVGVADSVEELIAEHASIERALRQIRMPRMSPPELEEIVQRGLASVGMTADATATQRITLLSQGLPHYTHLLAQAAASAAVTDDTDHVEIRHVQVAMNDAISGGDQSLSQRYSVAIASPRKNNLYSAVLLAAALTDGDDLGYFTPASVREPLNAITEKTYDIPQFVKHLHAFCENDRGPVLQKTGVQHRNRFRFRNPMLQPYVIMKALASGEIDLDTLDRFLSVGRR